MKTGNPLLALSGAALSLPAFAASQPVESEISVRTSHYKESDVSNQDLLSGSKERYDIKVNQFRLLAPYSDAWSIALTVSKENMSGASPWGTVIGPGDKPTLIMSGATIHESRTEVGVAITHYQEDSSIALGITRSDEDDYKSRAFSLSGEWDFNNRLTTLALGLSYSSDEIEPTDALIFGRPLKRDKHSRSLSTGLTQVINAHSVIAANVSVTKHEGYLTDPYKLLDRRPDERTEWAASLRYRRYFDNQNAALHLDYRYYTDDFGIDSHTVTSAWYQKLGAMFTLAPNVRYYSQGKADFYLAVDNYLLPPSIHQSSDYRLSGYGAYTFGIKAVYDRTNWRVSIDFDRYISKGSYGLHTHSDHPARLSYNLASIGFDFRF